MVFFTDASEYWGLKNDIMTRELDSSIGPFSPPQNTNDISIQQLPIYVTKEKQDTSYGNKLNIPTEQEGKSSCSE